MIVEAKKTISKFPNFNWESAIRDSSVWDDLSAKQKRLAEQSLKGENK